MINKLLISSKNRACQLDLLLNSININSNNIFDNINVLYLATDSFYQQGYDILKNKYKNVNFIKQKNYQEDFKNISKLNPSEYITFLVDDRIFYDEIKISKDQLLQQIKDDVVCFSLRLGNNCIYSHPANIYFKIKEESYYNNFMKWDWTKQQIGDFKYPLSTDGHVFKYELMCKILKCISFNNANVFQVKMQNFLRMIPQNMVSFKTSKILVNPINLVNNTHQNRNGLQYNDSFYDLNKFFVQGNHIDFDKLVFFNVNGRHKEIKLL